jgi:hypothetical protein
MTPRILSACLVSALLVTACGCAPRTESTAPRTFDSPDAAVEALVATLERRDRAELAAMLGPGAEAVLNSGDRIADSVAVAAFLERHRARHVLVAGGPDDLVLQVGEDDWPLPFPIVRRNGRWSFDGAAGNDEIVMRRIGRNELATIDVMNGFVEAQMLYADRAHDGVPEGTYAQKLRSDPGKQDGLYWEAGDGEAQSPAGPLLAAATAEGYGANRAAGEPYHGYHFRPLLSQGAAAPGGAAEYVVDGRQTRGFALLAWPAVYGSSGVMSFLVNQDGVVWQKDLGEGTEQAAAGITAFDPDTTWTPIPPEE